jgi:endo-1,4-beta-xylanase
MKNKFLFLPMLAGFSLAAAQTILSSWDFENGKGDWGYYNNGSVTASVNWSGTPAYAGNAAAVATVTTTGTANWHYQLQTPTFTAKKGEVYRFEFMGKGPATTIHVSVSDENGNYKNGFNADLTGSYQSFASEYTAKTTETLRFNFMLASTAGTYYVDNVKLSLLATLDDTWYSGADARIEANRKKDIVLGLQDASGKALANKTVRVTLARHAFPFGTALAFDHANPTSTTEVWYKETVAKYFWAGVLENDFKWPSYEPSKGTIAAAQTKVEDYLDWSEAQGWELMRGHALEWGIENYNYNNHWPRLLGSRAAYLGALKTRINRDMAQYKGRFQQYDVWNEVFHEPALFDAYGWDILDSAYIWARAADPSAKLFLNEYSVVAGGLTQNFVDVIQGFIDRKVPLDGIGVQCHFDSTDIDPADVQFRLDRLAKFNLPIVVTEFDMNLKSRYSEKIQADNYSKFMRAAYSHPAVQGIIMWGFWDSRHWITNGGIFNADKTPKLAADSLYKLWHTEWTTSVEGTTDANGKISFRGFPGQYKVTYQSGSDWVDAVVGSTTTPVLAEPRAALNLRAPVQLYSTLGQRLWTGTLRTGQPQGTQLNHSQLAPGLYLLRQNGQARLVRNTP